MPVRDRVRGFGDTLRAHGVRATFFLIGSKAELHPEIVRRMAAEGHAIGIHTWSHTPGFPMLRSGAMAADILRCRESLREITGVETDLFRPPYGVTNPMVARAVKRTGSRCVGWSIRSLDGSAAVRPWHAASADGWATAR